MKNSSEAMAPIREVAHRLATGMPGEVAIELLAETHTTLKSLSPAISRVRCSVLERDERCPEYDDRELRAFCDPVIDALLTRPMAEQHSAQRAHRRNPTWSHEKEETLARLRILPSSMDAFRLTKHQIDELKRSQESSLLRKNETLLVVDDAPGLLQTAMAMLEASSPADSDAKLLLPLLLVSGRRSSELTNGCSSFLPLPDEFSCMFSGQLKKKGSATMYRIPLLVPYDLFNRGLSALRTKQGHAQASNQAASRRYQGNMQRDLHKGVLRGVPADATNHSLRSIYVAFVFELFVPSSAFPNVAMKVLGHETMVDSMSYANVRLDGLANLRGSYGPLLLP